VSAYDQLVDHFSNEPGTQVLLERRADERRAASRRRRNDAVSQIAGRRRIRGRDGRRVAERRAVLKSLGHDVLVPPHLGLGPVSLTAVERVERSSTELREIEGTRIALRAQAGDAEALDRLYRHYHDPLLSWLSVELEDWHEVEDLAHEAFAKALSALSEWERRHESGFGSWLFRIARNEQLMYLRTKDREVPEEQRRIGAERDAQQLRDARRDPEPIRLSAEWVADPMLSATLNRLSRDQLHALILRYQFGYEVREIAEILGKTPDAMQKTISRTMAFIKSRVAGSPDLTSP
jgi:RNA polymerase sigma-70 factor (ECF subfamily)